MNGAILLIPFLLIRFGLLAFLNKSAIPRAAHFAALQGGEKFAYYVYQISNAALFIYLFFLRIKTAPPAWFYAGLALYILGLCLCIFTMIGFSSPDANGMNTGGIYRFSRNPMYVAYFVCFVGMALLTQSRLLLCIIILFQISTHWIILSEERWCQAQFGDAYRQYMKDVRRYF